MPFLSLLQIPSTMFRSGFVPIAHPAQLPRLKFKDICTDFILPLTLWICGMSFFHFPNMHYVVVSTADNSDIDGQYVELSFVARVVSYNAILEFPIIIILLVLKSLAVCDSEETVWTEKPVPMTYGMTVVEDDDNETGSSESLYDSKVCIICYDDQRSCFFIPCGHCATCYACAQRVMEENNKMCPIYRKRIQIQKVRKLFTP